MPIDFACSQCQHTLRVPDDSAGKKPRCPQCGNIQQIPYQPEPAPPYVPPYGGAGLTPDPYHRDSPAASPYQSPTAGHYVPERKSLDEVRSRVKPPAIAMLVIASLLAMLAGLMAVYGAVAEVPHGDEGDVAVLVVFAIGFIMQLVVVVGSARMLVLKNYGLAMTAAVLSLVGGLCCQLALPFGIWALVILADADVREQFT